MYANMRVYFKFTIFLILFFSFIFHAFFYYSLSVSSFFFSTAQQWWRRIAPDPVVGQARTGEAAGRWCFPPLFGGGAWWMALDL